MAAKTFADKVHAPVAKIEKLSIGIYSKGGVGKTSILSTMPGEGLILDVPDIEGGTYVIDPAANPNIEVYDVDVWKDFEEVRKGLASGVESKRGKPFKWVALDTLSAAQDLAKRETKKGRAIDVDPSQVTQPEWGQIGERMTELIYQFRALKIHTIFLAQEQIREVDDGISMYVPAISPMSLTAFFPPQHLVGRMWVTEVLDDEGGIKEERRMRVGAHEKFMTKARCVPGRVLPSVIADPDLKSILGWMLGVKNAKKPTAAPLGGLSFSA